MSAKKNKKPAVTPGRNSAGKKQNYYFVLGAIILITIIAYFPVFQNKFVNWDEEIYIRDNLLIRTFDLGEIFSRFQIGNYHPVTMLVYAIEFHLFGLNEVGYHIVDLLLHLLNVYLVYRLILSLSGRNEIALIASLLFGIHPMHVESVAWAAELKDLLYSSFFLASYLFYLSYSKNNNRKDYTWSLLLFLLSLLSKAMAASLPVLLILTDYFTGKKINAKSLLEKAPFFVLSLVFGIIAVIAQKESGATDVIEFPFVQRVIFACYGFASYLIKIILPFGQSAFYPYPIEPGESVPAIYFLSLIACVLIAALVFYYRKRSKIIVFCAGFFTITIFLVLQLLPVGSAIMADRYAYIPSIAVFYLAAEGLFAIWNNKKHKSLAGAILVVATIFYSAKTFARTKEWKNAMTLWTSVIEIYPKVAMAYSNRGLHLANENRFEESLVDLNKAIELKPDHSKVYLNRGLVHLYLSQYDEAIKDYNMAIELDPEYAEAYNNRGQVYKDRQQFGEAMRDFDTAIRIDPKLANAYNNKGFILMYQNKADSALLNYQKAIDLNPELAEAYSNRGVLYINLGKPAEALSDFNKSLEVQPMLPQSYFFRAVILMNQKKNEEAYDDFTRAIAIDSTYTDAYANRAVALQNMNRFDEALRDCNTAIMIEPTYAQAFYNRGMLYLKIKRYDEAKVDLTKSLEFAPENGLAYLNRGIAEYFSGDKKNACADISVAAARGVPNASDMFNKFCK